MTMTIELPDTMEQQLRAKFAREGRRVDEGILSVFAAWLASDSARLRKAGQGRVGCLARRLGKTVEVGDRDTVKLSPEELRTTFDASAKWADIP